MSGIARRISPAYSEPDYSQVAKYIGRTYEQANCWEIAREFYMREFHLELRQYYSGRTPDNKEVESLISTHKGEFTRVEGEPRYGDLVLIKLKGVECHLGVYIQKGKFLHSSKGTGSVLESVERYKHLIIGYFRHKGFHE